MAKVFLTCFSPFSPREKPLISSSIHATELASGVLLSLANDLQELRRSIEEKSISLHWCSEAMFIIKKMHSYFLLFSEKSQVPMSLDHASLMDEYLRGSLDLLDFCVFLKSATSSLDRYRLTVDFTVKKLFGDGFSSNYKKEIEGLAREDDKLFDVKRWKDKLNVVSQTKLKCTNNMHVVYIITSTMTTISLLIFCSMLHPMPIKFDEEIYCKFPDYNVLSNAIQKLVSCFYEISKCVGEKGRVSLLERSMIEDAIEQFKVQLTEGRELEKEKILESLEMLRKKSVALKEGLDVFESVVNEVFEDVINGRRKVVALITAKHCNIIIS
ncbi:hypothetical protein Ancab_038212 [Ancistrocladus abbreviatus]